jgi:hypothetical protein
MPRSKVPTRVSWEDRFNRPTAASLRRDLGAAAVKLFDAIRRRLLEYEGIQETCVWMGYCWRWSLEYRLGRAKDPLAIVVPSPQDLQLAIPMDRDLGRALAQRRMGRAVRDGLELAAEPFDTRWAVWSIHSMNLLDDLHDLLEIKLRHQNKKVG